MTQSLWSYFLTNQKRAINKHHSYFPAYERHFSPFVGRSITMLEIGVQNGGSAQMWKQYFGPACKIVGIDIDPKCANLQEPNIFIRIGSQADTKFLKSVIDEFGVPDIVLDDGSHQMDHINTSFDFLFPLMGKNSLYMVEDLHTAYWENFGGGVESPKSFINRSKDFIDYLNAHHSRGQIKSNEFNRTVSSIHFYDSIVCIEKNEPIRGGSFQGAVADVWDPKKQKK